MASIARADLSASGSFISSVNRVGMICQDTPYLSLSQPHGPSSPPSVSRLQNRSTSSWLSQFTWKETASLKVNSGPPLRATNAWPSSSKLTVMTVPSGLGPALP